MSALQTAREKCLNRFSWKALGYEKKMGVKCDEADICR